MRNRSSAIAAIVSAALVALLFAEASAAGPIRSGETARVHYTCRQPDGKILATTQMAVAELSAAAKSPVFIPSAAFEPVQMVAGAPYRADKRGPTGVQGAIEGLLAERIAGLEPKKTHLLELRTEAPPMPDSERYLTLARVMQRPLERWFDLPYFRNATGQEPEPGMIVFRDSEMPWEVTAVNEEKVQVRFLLKDGDAIRMPFGPGIVRVKEDHVDVHLQVKEGDLLRTAGYVGRIVKMGEKTFEVDFGHPFGGQDLTCEVFAENADTTRSAAGSAKESKGRHEK